MSREHGSRHDPRGVFAALEEACAAYPEQRVAQVIVNALGRDPFMVEDARAIELLRHYAAGGTWTDHGGA